MRIEEQIRSIVAAGQPFVRKEHTFDEGIALFKDQPYKTEIIEGVRGTSGDLDPEIVAEASPARVRRVPKHAEFVDLCRGPHMPSTAASDISS